MFDEKLFHEKKGEYYKRNYNKYQPYYTDKIVEDFRKEAMKKFPEFLSTEISGFNLFLFGSSFLRFCFMLLTALAAKEIETFISSIACC